MYSFREKPARIWGGRVWSVSQSGPERLEVAWAGTGEFSTHMWTRNVRAAYERRGQQEKWKEGGWGTCRDNDAQLRCVFGQQVAQVLGASMGTTY